MCSVFQHWLCVDGIPIMPSTCWQGLTVQVLQFTWVIHCLSSAPEVLRAPGWIEKINTPSTQILALAGVCVVAVRCTSHVVYFTLLLSLDPCHVVRLVWITLSCVTWNITGGVCPSACVCLRVCVFCFSLAEIFQISDDLTKVLALHDSKLAGGSSAAGEASASAGPTTLAAAAETATTVSPLEYPYQNFPLFLHLSTRCKATRCFFFTFLFFTMTVH